MAEFYATKLDASDDRVKTQSVTEVTYTREAYVESAYAINKDAGVQITDKKADLYAALEAGKITKEQYEKSISELREFSEADYAQREIEAEAKEAASVGDEAAAAEIIKDISKEREEEKEEIRLKVKFYATNYREHIIRATKMRLISRDTSLDAEKEKELDRIETALKELEDACRTKYSNTKTFADRYLSSGPTPPKKKLSGAFQQDSAFKYEGK